MPSEDPVMQSVASRWWGFIVDIQQRIEQGSGTHVPAPLIASAIMRAVYDAGIDFEDCGDSEAVYERIKTDLIAGRMDREVYAHVSE